MPKIPKTKSNFLVYSWSQGSGLMRCGTSQTARDIERITLRYGGREREKEKDQMREQPSVLVASFSLLVEHVPTVVNLSM